jgi:hypothetical protein
MLTTTLLVLSIACPIVCACLGFFVTTRPPSRYKFLFEIAFVLLAITGVVYASWLAQVNNTTQHALNSQIKHLQSTQNAGFSALAKVLIGLGDQMHPISNPTPSPVAIYEARPTKNAPVKSTLTHEQIETFVRLTAEGASINKVWYDNNDTDAFKNLSLDWANRVVEFLEPINAEYALRFAAAHSPYTVENSPGHDVVGANLYNKNLAEIDQLVAIAKEMNVGK